MCCHSLSVVCARGAVKVNQYNPCTGLSAVGDSHGWLHPKCITNSVYDKEAYI